MKKRINVVVKVVSKSEFPDYEKRIEREIECLARHSTITNVINFEGKQILILYIDRN